MAFVLWILDRLEDWGRQVDGVTLGFSGDVADTDDDG